MEKAIYKHSTLVLLLSHLVYSHITGLDVSKAITAVFLIALHGYNIYLQKLELPDLNKDFADFKIASSNEVKITNAELVKRMDEFEASMTKYDAFFIKNQNNPLKTVRF